MNSTFFSSFSNSSTINTDSWLVPINILSITLCSLAIVLGVFFLLIIAIDKTCYTVPMMLVSNVCLSAVGFSIEQLWSNVIVLQNDLQRIYHQDRFCVFRGYLAYSMCAAFICSFLLQSLYRYITVVYPTHIKWQSRRAQLFLICLTWIYGFIVSFPLIFTDGYTYNVNNQICDVALRFSFERIYVACCVYCIPVPLITLVYLKLIQYIKQMNQRVTPVNILLRAQRELKMARRTIIMVIVLIMFGVPYLILILIAFFIPPPVYHYRISYLFVDFSLACSMTMLFQFTDPLKLSIMKRLNIQATTVVPAVARIES